MPILPERGETFRDEQTPLTEVGKAPEINELGSLKPVSPQSISKPVVSDQGQVVLSSSSPVIPKIVLPMNQQTFFDPKTIHKSATEAVRWLLVWIKKIIAQNPGTTVFKKQENE